MLLSLQFLASADPLDHVKDWPIGEGAFWHFGEESYLQRLSEALWSLGVGKQTLMFALAGLLTLLFFWSYTRNVGRSAEPGRWGGFVEVVLEILRDQIIRPFMGTHGDKYVPLVATFFVYILCSNLLGLIPFFELIGHGGSTATGNILINAGLALCAFTIYHGIGIQEQGGFKTYVKNLFPHVPVFILPLMVVVELVAHVVRPCALAIRLFANMRAGHILLAVFLGFTHAFTKENPIGGGAVAVVSVLAMTALTFLELLVALIQAFVFTFLTTVFLSMAVHPEH
jgi:F-type H+-transporting ATPase subunit a